MGDSYDETPYPTSAEARLHVGHLRLCTVLNGYSPAPPQSARVLEIGCGNGFNLAPMAEQFPDAYFLGLDRAASAIETGKACLQQAGLANIELRCVDLIDAAQDEAARNFGHFDYIIAHGFYSWVPENVREAMWTLVRRTLAPQGVLHLSYNALPGWYGAQAVRDFAQFLAGQTGALASTVDRTWEALGVLAPYADSGNPFAQEAARIRGLPMSVLAHDELGEACQAFYLTDVVRRAQKEGFRHAGEAGSHIPSDLRKHEQVADMVISLSKRDALLQAQLLDFTSMRRFHDTLFTWESHAPVPLNIFDTLLNCWACSDIRFVEEGVSGERVYEHAGGVRITSGHPLFCGLADAMEAASPASVPLRQFMAEQSESSDLPEPIQAMEFTELIRSMVNGAVIRLRMDAVPVARELSPHPRTSRFARLQVAREGEAPNAYHACVPIADPWRRALFTLLDGTRDHTHLAEALTSLTWSELHPEAGVGRPEDYTVAGIASSQEFSDNPGITQSRESLLAFYRERIPTALDEFLRDALLLEEGRSA